MKNFCLIIVALLLTGCSIPLLTVSVDHQRLPPADFPKMDVVIHRKAADRFLGLQVFCPNEHQNKLLLEASCVVPDFATNTCNIYTWKSGPREERISHAEVERRCLTSASPYVLRGQCWRCLGYERPGEMTIRDAWSTYKQSR